MNQSHPDDHTKRTSREIRVVVGESISFLLENSLFLVLGAAVALVWANVDAEAYHALVHGAIHFAVNDVLMAFFFGIAAKEIWESILPGGALSDPRKAAMPLLATVGGMVGPIAVYLGGCYFFDASELVRGWAIPCATDIAFAYLAARLIFGPGSPAIPFLLLLAIADDAAGLIILAIAYPQKAFDPLAFFGLVGAAIASGIFMARVLKVHSFWPYIILSGGLSWAGFYLGGLHPALSLVPVIPTLPHAKTDLGLFARSELDRHDTLNEFEHWWEHPVELVLGLFGFVNAGVVLTTAGLATGLVLGALVLGKPLGIMAFGLIGSLFGLELPQGMGYRELFVLSLIAGIGFTVSLFIATVAFTGVASHEVVSAAKMGALASFGVFGLAWGVGRLLKVHEQDIR